MAEIFLSHASEQRSIAEALAFSLRSNGHNVFLDKDDLPAATSYDSRIRTAIAGSDLMLFLVSPHSTTAGSYTLTEVEFARQKWRKPHNRVLPVMAVPTDYAALPSFLAAVTVLEPRGNLVAEASAEVEKLFGRPESFGAVILLGFLGALAGVVSAVSIDVIYNILQAGTIVDQPLLIVALVAAPGVALGTAIGFGIWRWGGRRLSGWLSSIVIVAIGVIMAGVVSNQLPGAGLNAGFSFEGSIRSIVDGVIFGVAVFAAAAWNLPYLRRFDTFALLTFVGGALGMLSLFLAQSLMLPIHVVQSLLLCAGTASALGLSLSRPVH